MVCPLRGRIGRRWEGVASMIFRASSDAVFTPTASIRNERTRSAASPSLVLAISPVVDDFPVTTSMPVSWSFQRTDSLAHLLLKDSIIPSEGRSRPSAWTTDTRPTGSLWSLYRD
ncbi:hypothetical protein B0T18DRAFT_421233 [Schizothecium vesticola]|uniref:Uncharacterized protein n=1 Tax=Schizothecium vesticola TaxID=314040 RepID=A0AA40BPL6_9PEZI|nr:hypothetical protein B0T18DRAFT_421233 [Schizothecium vesticola]